MNLIFFKKIVKSCFFSMLACVCFICCDDSNSGSSENMITEFSVTIDNAEASFAEREISLNSVQLSPTINQSEKTITATVPYDANLSLIPEIKISDKASISPALGVRADFSRAVNYTVTAENGSTNTYAVRLTKAVKPTLMEATNSLRIGETATFKGYNLKVDGFKTQIKFVYLHATDSRVAAIIDAEPNAAGTEVTLVLPESLPKMTYWVSVIVGGVETDNEILNVASN